MKTLLLLRHAKSSWKDKKLKDKDRPLKKKGEEGAAFIGKVLLENELVPQVILSSSAERAKQTAEIVAKVCKIKEKVTLLDSYYLAEPQAYLDGLKDLPDQVERALIVGHNPSLEGLMQVMDGKIEALPTGGLAYLVLQLNKWSDISIDTAGELIGFWQPAKEEITKEEVDMAKEKKDKKDKKEKKEKKEKKGKKDKK